MRLAYASSSMKTELAAIVLATWLDQLQLYTGAVIFSDSLSGLTAMKNATNDNFVHEILITLSHLRQKHITVNFEWIPAHCGLQNNEKVDYFAKLGLSNRIEIHNKTSFSSEKSKVLQKTNEEWQQRWQKTEYPLKQIQPTVPSNFSSSLTRNEEKIIHRLRTGVMGLNEDLHKIGLHDNGYCNECSDLETVQHFLISCPKYIIPRAMLIAESNLAHSGLIMTLLKSTNPNIERALVRFVQRTKRLELN